MSWLRSTFIGGFAALVAATGAVAQAPTPTPAVNPALATAIAEATEAAGGSTVIEALVVIGRPPGPAMWRVQMGDSELIILGSVTPIHHQQQWNDRRVRRALTGARLLLTPVEAKAGVGDMAKFIAGGAFKVRTLRGGLEKDLPPDLRARFVNIREQAKEKASRYDKWKPAVAGALLMSDYRKAGGLSEAKPASQVEDIARAMGVPVKAMAELPLSALVRATADLSDAQQLVCIRAFINQTDFEGGRYRKLGEVWAEGDLAGVRRYYPSQAYETCLGQVGGGQALREKAVADSTATLRAALRTPGKTVAIVDLGQLQRRNGVLDRLQAAGAVITVPLDS